MRKAGQNVHHFPRLGELTPVLEKNIQSFTIGSVINAIRIGNIKSWKRVSIMVFGLIFRTPYCFHLSAYNTNNEQTTTPYIYVDKIKDSMPFNLYWKKEGTGLELYIEIADLSSISGDAESVNIAGNCLAEKIKFTNDGSYTKIDA